MALRQIRRICRKLGRPFRLIEDVERFIAYRTYDKYHVVKTDLSPGYYDKDTILLHSVFALLVDFVEVEYASSTVGSNFSKWLDKFEKYPLVEKFLLYAIPNFLIYKVFGNPERKSRRQLGEEHLNWIINLKPSPEDYLDASYTDSFNAFGREVLELYTWWKDIRPNRPDDMDASGLSEFYDKMRDKYGSTNRNVPEYDESGKIKWYRMESNLNEEEEKEYRDLINKSMEIEKSYDDEDTRNLIRVMNIRKQLWT